MIHVIGDLLIDHTIIGDTFRISPEAPTPVLLVRNERYNLGGAGNVFMNCKSLNYPAILHSVVSSSIYAWMGDYFRQSNGNEKESLKENGIFVAADPKYTTPVKNRLWSAGQQLMRYDIETPNALPSANVIDPVLNEFAAGLKCSDVIVVADYAKGFFTAERAAKVLEAARRYSIPVLVDAKPSNMKYWKGATLCTPNREEALQVAALDNYYHLAFDSGDPSDAALAAASYIQNDYRMDYVVMTQGKDGAAIVRAPGHKPRHYSEYKAEPIRVYDVTGAGDSFMAALAIGLANNWDIETAVARAVWAGCLAVQQHGVAQVKAAQWEDAYRLANGPSGKILTMPEAIKYANLRKLSGDKVVLTNGCFDVLHAGHLSMLQYAKSQGDVLLVAVDDDANVTRLKGPTRPMTPEALRQLQLATLPFVDRVTLFSGDMETVVKAINPDVLVKGGDYRDKPVVGADYVINELHGQVVIANYLDGVSTTKWADSAPST